MTTHPDEARLLQYRRDPRRAISESGVMCLECGRSFRHLTNRALMISPARRTHADNARTAGLADRIRQRPILLDVGLRRRGGRHPHALEERLTRRERR